VPIDKTAAVALHHGCAPEVHQMDPGSFIAEVDRPAFVLM